MENNCGNKDFRVRIIQTSVPEYRVGLFEGLGARYAGRIDIMASPEGRAGVPSVPLKNMPYEYSHVLLRLRNFYWQKGLSLRGLKARDVLVICGEIKGLSNIVLAIWAKIRGLRLIWWGHHWSTTSTRLSCFLRLQFAKMVADSYLCYTLSGVDFLRRHGFNGKRLFATGNTIDEAPVTRAIEHWRGDALSAFHDEQGIADKNLILICGVIREKMRLNELVIALKDDRLVKRNVCLAVIGDGPARVEAQKLAKTLGVSGRIKWVGATRDQGVMAPWFLSAKAFAYPGAIGLSIIHALSYGLPVVVNNSAKDNGPEYEIMEDGKTGYVFKRGDVSDLVDKIAKLCDDSARRVEMSEYSREKVLKHYTIGAMVENFARAIDHTHDRR